MKILGISAFYHDAAACIIQDGQILAAAQEERFSRKKHDPDFPLQAINYCLDYSGYSIEDLDAVAFYDKPLLKFERLLETYYNFAPKGLSSFIKSIPIWTKEKLFLKSTIKSKLGIKKHPKIFFPEHHLSHAASAFYPSNFEEAAILTIDGVGEWATASIAHGFGNKIKVIKELQFPNSLGLLYSAFTYFLGFRVNSGEYKLMGLAPYGNLNSKLTQSYIEKIEQVLIDLKPDGSLRLNPKYFKYAYGLRMIKEKKWEELFGFPKRKPETQIDQQHTNLAIAIQKVTEKVVIQMAQTAQGLTNSKHLCLAGGVALNCVANGKLQNQGIFEDIFIQPAAGDAGGALGAALATFHIHFAKARTPIFPDAMQGAYLGPEFTDKDIEKIVRKYDAPNYYYGSLDELVHQTANLISNGHVIGWFQGRMEFGPRALGNRSIIGDPRSPEMQKKINLKIKYRESFRPFAPSVLEEDAHQFFEIQSPSPYMLIVQDVLPERRNTPPPNYENLNLRDKLYHLRSDIPAITHVDYSARIQTVNKQTNERYHALLTAFKELTSVGMLINTSFNVRGEPIVCTPEDAYKCFLNTEMDYLVMGNFIFEKSQQKQNVNLLSQNFQLD